MKGYLGGVDDDHIRFLCAPGMHRPLVYQELVAKLGADIVSKYPVYNHNCYENLVHIGNTSRGTPLYINREYVSCDLRIGIGSLIPHGSAGFGGGGKIILPGIAGIDTVHWHHTKIPRGPAGQKMGVGRVDGNIFRLDIEEAARLADLQFKVDAVLNGRREIVGLFAGDFVAAHRAASAVAREVYSTRVVGDADIVVTNSYPDESQVVRSAWCVPLSQI
nr:lactate racemase domain-containing protein [Dehalococcoidales bacterium]